MTAPEDLRDRDDGLGLDRLVDPFIAERLAALGHAVVETLLVVHEALTP